LPSGHVVMRADPVVAAGVGVRRGRGWVVRAASFRIGQPMHGKATTLGIQIDHPAEASAIVDLLAGLARPAYGELRVLGHDMATARGRAAVRRRVGVARRAARPIPAMRVRGLVEHAARLAGPQHDRRVLAAGILDQLSLIPWAEVALRAAPDAVARRARLAAAAVHQPELILLDGLLDGLQPRDSAALSEAVRDLSRDSAFLVAGCDGLPLELACDEVLVLADGILVNA
jgi:ABC-2 type transport system ATP-binding protein